MALEQINDGRREGDCSVLVDFCRREVVLTALLLFFPELLFHCQDSTLQINAIPGQPQDLPLAQACEQRNFVQVFVRMVFDAIQEGLDL